MEPCAWLLQQRSGYTLGYLFGSLAGRLCTWLMHGVFASSAGDKPKQLCPIYCWVKRSAMLLPNRTQTNQIWDW